ncbi:hypothetical protein D0Z07_0603 [Hyphodiscus hymeniophilus]|uniref:Uncharacterized protein n=1 Tax=Hyphodiscus hymeniophilus TaxID=353542 RepID=A0A9P6VSK1_9HELO|nr:hypothetical protein D0Z07_0603 [Hyphodiscus hymeniophilus]
MAPAPPPPYEAAVYRRLWAIVAPYVHDFDLYSACLVCRQWHSIFSPLLWGNPGSRFGNDSDNIYLSLTRFKRLLVRARHDVRRLAHTLHIPPAQPEFYGGPQAGWLRDILDRLPSLQALIVENLSFFDHQALETVHQTNGSPLQNDSKYGLRLLIASHCENTTAASLAKALFHFPDLIYLDLSSTQGSRNPLVLQQIGTLRQLYVLKMKNCGLRDFDVDLLTFSDRLRSLDVSDNYLTERGVSSLMDHLPASSLKFRSLSITSRPRARTKTKRPTLQKLVSSSLISGPGGHLLIENGLPSTFADLYLAGNYLTLDELSRVLSYPSIEYLDCGSLNCSQRPEHMLSPGSPGSDRRRFSAQGIDSLSPALFTEAFRNIRSLRIHHSVVTSFPFSGKDTSVAEECFELHSEDLRYELDSTEVADLGTHGLVFELDDTSKAVTPEPVEIKENVKLAEDAKFEESTNTTKVTDASVYTANGPENGKEPIEKPHAVFESPDDVGANLSPSPSIRSQSNVTDDIVSPMEPSFASRKSAPPKISMSAIYTLPSQINQVHRVQHIHRANHSHPLHHNHSTSIPLIPTSAPHGPETFRYKYSAGEDRHWHEAGQSRPHTDMKELIEEVKLRRHRTEARERHSGRFKPSMLPNLKVLTLTDVPSTTRRRNVIKSLTLFMQECAEEEELAKLEELERQIGRNPCRHQLEGGGIFKLQRLVLEMTSAPDPIAPQRFSRSKRNSFTKSSTEDADSESFMEASETDFSFFGEDDGGLLVSEGRIDAPRRVDDGMIVNGFLSSPTDTGHSLDVVSELSGFRKEMRAKHEAMVQFGKSKIDSALLGHWVGEVKVVKTIVGA